MLSCPESCLGWSFPWRLAVGNVHEPCRGFLFRLCACCVCRCTSLSICHCICWTFSYCLSLMYICPFSTFSPALPSCVTNQSLLCNVCCSWMRGWEHITTKADGNRAVLIADLLILSRVDLFLGVACLSSCGFTSHRRSTAGSRWFIFWKGFAPGESKNGNSCPGCELPVQTYAASLSKQMMLST